VFNIYQSRELFNLKSSVGRLINDQSDETKQIFFQMPLTIKVKHAIVPIAHCSLLFAALQFVVITCYYASLRLAKNKQQCTLSTIQLRILGLIINEPRFISGLQCQVLSNYRFVSRKILSCI